jgi:hypothetical protein
VSQRFDDHSPIRCGQPAEVMGIGGVHHAASRFDRHRDRVGVCEQLGAGSRLGEQCADEASQAAIGVTEQQPVSRARSESSA